MLAHEVNVFPSIQNLTLYALMPEIYRLMLLLADIRIPYL